jgi:hypothetical protein
MMKRIKSILHMLVGLNIKMPSPSLPVAPTGIAAFGGE